MDEKTPADFGRADVERGGWAPWTDSAAFADELDVEDMGDTAAAYLRAATEVSTVGDLSRRATELSADAGALDGDALVDAEGRIEVTERDLGEGEVQETVRLLVRSMNLAVSTEEEVRALVHGPGALDERFEEHLAGVRDEYHAAQAAVAALNAEVPQGDEQPPVWELTVRGDTFRVEAPGGVYRLGEDVVAGIRQRHLDAARADATDTGLDIREAVEVYRRELIGMSAELDPYGFDLTGGPLGLWTTPEMAAWSARGLLGEFIDGGGRPDTEKLLYFSEGLDALVRSVFGTNGDPGAAARDMTEEERAFLVAFFRALDEEPTGGRADILSGLGGDQPLLEDPGDQGRHTATLQRLADGVSLLLNPQLGGIDPRDPANADDVPLAVRRFVYDEPAVAWAREPVTESEVDARWGDLNDLNGFGGLMATASVGPGEHFGRDLAGAATRVQTQLNDFSFDFGKHNLPPIEVTGPDGMLRAVSESGEVSAGLLADRGFRDSVLDLPWADGAGPALLIENGTAVPAGVEPGSAEARPYERAAGHVAAGAEYLFPEAGEGARVSAADRRIELALADLRGDGDAP
ncbi:hypothetical protein [Streptomyces avicenniae]|uniref:hypothetical protein n=1 Tax=Streptomyces avicenniae TaxID=500153 RepID=UPI000699D49E|nr:hypothetical protein [Streptomyces avicenniae]